MADTHPLEPSFEQARRRRPDPLPAEFAASVMRQLAETGETTTRLPGFLPMAAAAVLTAAAIGLLSSPRPDHPQAPKLAVFGGNATLSPFVIP